MNNKSYIIKRLKNKNNFRMSYIFNCFLGWIKIDYLIVLRGKNKKI